MREDIQGGLRNAMEHGASLEQAIKSFISAGHSEAEVRDAAKIFTVPAIAVTNPQPTNNLNNPLNKQVRPLPARPPVQPQVQPVQQVQQSQIHSTLGGESGTNRTVIILVVVLIILIGAFIASLIFKDQIAQTLKTALGK